MTVSGNDGLAPEPGGMTPWLAFAISLIYCVTVDRDVDAHEVGGLVSAFGGKVSPNLIEGRGHEQGPVPAGGSVYPHP